MYAYLIDKKTCVVSLIYTYSEGAIIEGWETLHETENGGGGRYSGNTQRNISSCEREYSAK